MPSPLIRATALSPVTLDDNLPAGVIGRVEGIALVYDVVDDHGTIFQRGCLDRTARERVAAGRVKLFFDHGDAPRTGTYDTRLHVGTVRGLVDTELPGGQVGARITADVFDTLEGRACHQYLRSVQATSGETGLSVGFRPTKPTSRVTRAGIEREQFSEIALSEISITAMQSVPGAVVTAVRSMAEPLDYAPLLRGIHVAMGDTQFRAQVRVMLGDADELADSDADDRSSDSNAALHTDSPPDSETRAAPIPMPYEDRLFRVRQLIATR